MSREGDNNVGRMPETLCFAELVTRGRVEGLAERAVLVVPQPAGANGCFP